MTQQEVIREYCRIAALVYQSIGDYTHANDGFCDLCPFANKADSFRNEGQVINFIREAVVKLLKVRKIPIAAGFDLVTGKELIKETTDDKVRATQIDLGPLSKLFSV